MAKFSVTDRTLLGGYWCPQPASHFWGQFATAWGLKFLSVGVQHLWQTHETLYPKQEPHSECLQRPQELILNYEEIPEEREEIARKSAMSTFLTVADHCQH